jgi:hypothetical protein
LSPRPVPATRAPAAAGSSRPRGRRGVRRPGRRGSPSPSPSPRGPRRSIRAGNREPPGARVVEGGRSGRAPRSSRRTACSVRRSVP